jgi:hypothetical protein
MIRYLTLIFVFLFSLCSALKIEAQEWSTFFNFSKEIHKFAVSPSEYEFAVFDGQKLFLKNYDGEIANFTSFNFSFQEYTLKADLSKIIDMRYISDYLHVATSDSLLLMFYNEKFVAGIPGAYIFDSKSYQGDYLASCNLFGVNYYATIDVEDAEFDPWVCVDDENAFANYKIGDIASTDRMQSCIHSDNTILNTGNGELIINKFDMTKLPFKKFREIEWSDFVSYKIDGYNRSRLNLWALTDNGLAFYISEIDNGDFGNWKEENWKHLNKDNSWLRSNKIEHLETVVSDYREFFVIYANDPYPTVYFFDPKGEKVCIFDKTNSIISGNLPITNIYVNTDDDIYLTQGTKILKLEIQYDMSCLKTSSINLSEWSFYCEISPNPAYDILNIDSEREIDLLKLYDVNGQALFQTYDCSQVNISNLESGVYIVKIIFKDKLSRYMKFVKQ